jgi:ribonucleoside-triphosphate reductase (thioredoxin)
MLESYLKPNQRRVEMDYSQIRKAGIPLKTFGG